MITAVDTSCLLAIFGKEAQGAEWMELLVRARREGPLIVCETVVAEVAPEFPTPEALAVALGKVGAVIVPSTLESAHLAGQVFLEYRRQGGPRQHMIPDFLIAAHAQTHADRLAADDRGYLRRYFRNLRILKPA